MKTERNGEKCKNDSEATGLEKAVVCQKVTYFNNLLDVIRALAFADVLVDLGYKHSRFE